MVVLQVLCHYEFMIEMGPLMSENQVKKFMPCVASPYLTWLEEEALQLVISEPRFRQFWIAHKLEMHVSIMCWPNANVLVFFNRMDRPRDTVEEVAEIVNPREQGSSTSNPFESIRSDHDTELTESLLKISHDMAQVLERLTVPKALIYMVRRHGAEEFHGTSLEESKRAEFWLEKLQRVLDEVRCPPEQKVSCAISLLQSGAYD